MAVKREWTMLLRIEFSISEVPSNGINSITRLCSPAYHVGFNSLANPDEVNMLETMDVPETMDEAIIIISSESDDEQPAPSRSATKVFTPTKCPPSSSSESRFVIL